MRNSCTIIEGPQGRSSGLKSGVGTKLATRNEMSGLVNEIERIHVDAGYRGPNAPPEDRFKVYTSKQKRRLTPQIEREMRRRSAIER
jgi:hypothetical protein